MHSATTQLSSRSPDSFSSSSFALHNNQYPTRTSSSSSHHTQTPLLTTRSPFASVPRDTSSPFNQATKPSTPASMHVMQSTPPLTPPSSLSPTSSIASTVSLASTLSATAAQFQTSLLDAPIDIHTLAISDSTNSMSNAVSEPLPKAITATGPLPHSPDNMLDISMSQALLSEGPSKSALLPFRCAYFLARP